MNADAVLSSLKYIYYLTNISKMIRWCYSRSGVSNIYLTMYPFSVSADEHVPLKFHISKYFIMSNHSYILKSKHKMISEQNIHR